MRASRVTKMMRIFWRRGTRVSLHYERQRTQKENLCSVNAAEDYSFVKPSVT